MKSLQGTPRVPHTKTIFPWKPAVIAVGLIFGWTGCSNDTGQSNQTAQSFQMTTADGGDLHSDFDTERGIVQEVFSATNQGHRFIAYQVEWGGSKVIVSDTLAKSSFETGDEIQYMVQRTKIAGPMPVSSLSFMLLDAPMPDGFKPPEVSKEDQDRSMKLIGGDLDIARDEKERFYALNRAAKNALAAGKTEEAAKFARELETLALKFKDDWNYGNAIQDANQVLGRIALAKGDVDEAKKRLLASADSKGSPQMNSFGPNMQLAKDLLAKGETETVLKYFERCRKFWEMGGRQLDRWSRDAKAGNSPDFGAHLSY